jgi:ParB-like chromosome segregation protein Spo0J
MNIERFSLESLKPHPLNAKIYGAAESDQALIQSIEAVGVLNAIIVDQKGRILSGTRRWKACKALCRRSRILKKFTNMPM